MPDDLKAKVRLFADDTIIYLTIKSDADANDLQKDISKIIVRQSDQSIRGLSLVDIQENTIIDI